MAPRGAMMAMERMPFFSARSEKCSDCMTCNFQNPTRSRTTKKADRYENRDKRPCVIFWSLTFHDGNETSSYAADNARPDVVRSHGGPKHRRIASNPEGSSD